MEPSEMPLMSTDFPGLPFGRGDTVTIVSADCECERWRNGATVCPVHPDSTRPAGWGVTPERALKKAKKKIRKLRDEVGRRDLAIAEHKQEIFGLTGKVRRLETTIADMKTHWRPVPIAHEWQPRNPHCLYCDEPREAVRHQRTSWAEEYGDQPPAEQAN